MTYKNHTTCRVCNSDKLTPYLDLGLMPLSNNLARNPSDPIHLQTYPLRVLLCETCGLSQLSIVIPAAEMFNHYVYRSSISKGYLDHCHSMALELQEAHGLTPDSFHIDIAGNDGALLDEFKKVIGHKVLNIDPAQNLVSINEEKGIRVYSTFWGAKAAQQLNATGWPKADLVTATNVFAHVDDVKEFIAAVKQVLKPGTGVLVMEFPYLVDFIEKSEFDTVYFEHLSYFTVYPLTLLCQQAGLQVLKVSKQDIHGGSIRVTIGEGLPDESVSAYVQNERENYRDIKRYQQFSEDVQLIATRFRRRLHELRTTDKVAGFAASAKGNTLLNVARVRYPYLLYIVDETPEKIGFYSPGTYIPIVSMDHFKLLPPAYLVILSWNFAGEIIAKCRAAGYTGKFILPLTFEIID